MLRRYSVLAALPAIVLAACSTDVVAPLKVPTGPNLALSTGTTSGSYIVLLKGNSISPGFDEKVAALGGTVTYANAKVGFATVSGLPADAAGRLRAISGVADVQADATVSLDSPVPSAIADAALLGDPAINSQANPATAFYFARQWDMTSIHASSAWTAGKLGRSDVTVAILDTGIDYNSLDASTLVDPILSTSFMDTYVPGPTETNLTPVQLAARADDFVRSSFFSTRAAYTDFNGHGTNVASQVSSRATVFAGLTSR
ncbi:MAG TPA: S8 family serine peptidase, partial [Gemmatimonadaceae bacterium]|nr:S8 family serine peptidase [Gemmatimonadaceae bacterium]